MSGVPGPRPGLPCAGGRRRRDERQGEVDRNLAGHQVLERRRQAGRRSRSQRARHAWVTRPETRVESAAPLAAVATLPQQELLCSYLGRSPSDLAADLPAFDLLDLAAAEPLPAAAVNGPSNVRVATRDRFAGACGRERLSEDRAPSRWGDLSGSRRRPPQRPRCGSPDAPAGPAYPLVCRPPVGR